MISSIRRGSRVMLGIVVALMAIAVLARMARAQQVVAAPQTVEEARIAIAMGKYAEGTGFLEKVARADSAWMDAQVELARALLLISKFDDAERVARAAVAAPRGAEALTALGDVLRERGRYAAADSVYARAVREHSSDSLMASLNMALLAQARGDKARATQGFDRFIDVYNTSANTLTSREMMAVAIACRELGATNPELFKDALKAFDRAVVLDPANMDARVMLGELFLAKYNGAEAQRTLDEVLQINAAHPRALVAAASRLVFDGQPGADSLLNIALRVSPEFVPARVMMAHGMVDVERYDDAAKEAERALKVNPSDADALAVLAGARFVAGDDKGFEDAKARALAINPRDAGFFVQLAEMTGRVRRYSVAAGFARQAIAADPSRWKAHSVLGMNLMRLGKIPEAKATLDTAFKGDPYDVWVKNTLDLLDTFKNYDESSTEHVNFMIEKQESALLSVYVQDLAESAYKKFQQRYQYTPPPPIRIEVYRSHADFSVRTVGLAGLGALGVSFGTTLAFDSPAAKDAGPFNWASTVWHELAHTFTLGSTDHRIPRWLSEGLSVWEEHQARPGWGASVSPGFLDAYRTGKLVSVSRMNDGFMRPAFPEQIQYSYYQGSLVVDLIVRDFGEKAITALLAEYKAGRTTEEAFQKVTGQDMKAFDKRFDAFMGQRFAGPLAALAIPGPQYPAGMGPREFQAHADSQPKSYRAQVLAGVALMKAVQLPEAIRYLERAHALFPEYGDDDSPAALLVKLYTAAGDRTKAIAMLKVVVLGDESAYEANMQLGTMQRAAGDTVAAIESLDRAVFINPFSLDVHRYFADLAAAHGDKVRSVREREALVALDPVDKADALYQLALAYRNAGDEAKAKRAVLRALEDAPNFDKAQDLLLAIVDGRKP